MQWFSAIVVFAVIWTMSFLVLLPIGLRTQGEEGEITPGTHSGAPINFRLKRLAIWTSLVTLVLWSALYAVVAWGGLTLDDIGAIGRYFGSDQSRP